MVGWEKKQQKCGRSKSHGSKKVTKAQNKSFAGVRSVSVIAKSFLQGL